MKHRLALRDRRGKPQRPAPAYEGTTSTLLGFTVIDFARLDSDDELAIESAPRQRRLQPMPVSVVGAERERPDDRIRVAARTAVRCYGGSDPFIRGVRTAHETDRNWLPKLRTAQALLSIIDGLQANGAAMR